MCYTPPYPLDGAVLTVKVMLVGVDRAEYARCPSGGCTFQYRSDHTPTVARLSRAVGSLETLSFEGYLRGATGVSGWGMGRGGTVGQAEKCGVTVQHLSQ